MKEIINAREAETLKTVVGSLAKKVDELAGKVDDVVTAQGKVDTSLQEMVTARKTGTPVHFMKADDVKQTIRENLNSQLVQSTVKINVNNPVATIGKQSKEKIDDLITATGKLIDSNQSIKPRKPLLSITIYNGKKAVRFVLGVAVLLIIGMIWAIAWANKEVNSIQDQAFYWGDRAYQAMVRNDGTNPGEAYHIAVSHFEEQPDKVKKYVATLESEAERYQEKKQYLLSFIGGKDSRDIRLLAWELDHNEGWFLYRYYDEEVERSVHVWPDMKVEETTDKIVTDLASAQKNSKRKIWTVIREAPATTTE